MKHSSGFWIVSLLAGCYLSHARPLDLARGPHVRVSAHLSCAIAEDRSVRCWGSYVGLGGSTRDAGAAPTLIPGLEEVTSLAVSAGHACAVDGEGQVACWGFDEWGQAGTPRDEARPFHAEPVQIAELGPAREVATGWTHSCALLVDGRVACWGQDGLGGLPVDLPRSGFEDYAIEPVYLPGVDDGVELSVGRTSTCVRRREGSVLCWGENAFGECGPRDAERVHTIAGVRAIDLLNMGGLTLALDAEGNLHRWGATFELHSVYSATPGDGSARPAGRLPGAVRLIPADLPQVCGLTETFELICTEIPDDGVSVSPEAAVYYEALVGSSFREVAFGARHACVVTLDGEIACLGENGLGELGLGSRGDRSADEAEVALRGATRVVRGFGFACGLSSEGVFCWGGNVAGSVGSGAPSWQPASAPVRVALEDVTALSARGRHACAVAGGTVSCWGENTHGDVAFDGADAVLVPTPVDLPLPAREVAVAEYAACALVQDAVFCWGDDDGGLVGDPRFLSRMVPTEVPLPAPATSIAAGDGHVCAALTTGEVACWGDNQHQSIGAPFCDALCRARIEAGDHEHAHVIETPRLVPGVSDARVVRAGERATCASGPSGTDCWPSGGAVVHRSEPVLFVGGIDRACDPSGRCGAFDVSVAVEPIPLPAVDTILDLSFDERSGCVVDGAGDVRCWGPGGRGQLGNGDGYALELVPIL